MTCDQVRAALWTASSAEIDALEPHLATCRACAALAEAVREADARVEAGLEGFALAVPAASALAEARRQAGGPSAPDRRWKMFDAGVHWLATGAAAAAVLVSSLVMTGGPTERGASPPVAASLTSSRCADLQALEPDAMTGRLTDEVVACLEARVDADDSPALALRLLAVHAYSKPDRDAWTRYAQRLAAADPADPDIAYKLALDFSHKGVDHAEDAIRYAEQTLAVSGAWPEETRRTRSFICHKVRSAAAQQLWAADPDDDEARRRTLAFAQAWLAFAEEAGGDPEGARALCRAAGGGEACAPGH